MLTRTDSEQKHRQNDRGPSGLGRVGVGGVDELHQQPAEEMRERREEQKQQKGLETNGIIRQV